MFEHIDNLKLLSASRGVSRKKIHVENKKNHSFVYRTTGAGIFITEHHSYLVQENDLIFLPAGISYDFKTVSETECTYSSIAFQADIDVSAPKVFSLENVPEGRDIFAHVPELWKLGTATDLYRCHALFYTILSYLSATEHTDYAAGQKFSLIAPAVDYLRKHIFDSDLKAEHLHLLCGISDTYFRRIFMARFSTTPQKYIISKRLSYAKAAIENGDFDSVSDVAAFVGYIDPLYFSRAFKKKYGVSPVNINKES